MTTIDDALTQFSDRVYAKAESLLKYTDDRVAQDEDQPTVFTVRDQYRVQVYADGECSCTCPHGMNNVPAVCYHAAAALLYMRRNGQDLPERPDQTPTPTAEDDEEEAEGWTRNFEDSSLTDLSIDFDEEKD